MTSSLRDGFGSSEQPLTSHEHPYIATSQIYGEQRPLRLSFLSVACYHEIYWLFRASTTQNMSTFNPSTIISTLKATRPKDSRQDFEKKWKNNVSNVTIQRMRMNVTYNIPAG